MNAGQIAFAPPSGVQTARRSDGQELGMKPSLLHLAEEVIQPHAVAADDHQIGRLEIAAQ